MDRLSHLMLQRNFTRRRQNLSNMLGGIRLKPTATKKRRNLKGVCF